jgi:hypothetical protein
MEKTTITKFRIFLSWQDDKEEAWLGSMSREGWHLESFGFPGIYTFRKGIPKNYTYRLDFQTSRMKDKQVYLQLFQDAGWEYLREYYAWQYFRKEARPGEEPEIHTDPESKIQKYERIIWIPILYMSAMVALSTNIHTTQPGHGVFGDVLAFIMDLIALFYAITVMAIWYRIRRLKRK